MNSRGVCVSLFYSSTFIPFQRPEIAFPPTYVRALCFWHLLIVPRFLRQESNWLLAIQYVSRVCFLKSFSHFGLLAFSAKQIDWWQPLRVDKSLKCYCCCFKAGKRRLLNEIDIRAARSSQSAVRKEEDEERILTIPGIWPIEELLRQTIMFLIYLGLLSPRKTHQMPFLICP